MNEELLIKANDLFYTLTKDAAREDFIEYLEELDISYDEWEEIKEHLSKIGINKSYV